MRAWWVDDPGPLTGPAAGRPLVYGERPDPVPGPGELLVRVRVCGVCRTDLHLTEGDLPPKRHGVIPGHEVVGEVVGTGPGCTLFTRGERVGIAWLRSTCGRCRFCLSGRENLCLTPRFTGWDDDGGFAELATVPESFAYPLPDTFSDEEAAPLLCAGIIGYRALRRSGIRPGGNLGIYGFGASAHLAAQVAMFEDVQVHVMTRSGKGRRLARELGVASVGGTTDEPPVLLDAAIIFAPAGTLVPPALRALDRGGTLAVAGIYLSAIPELDYDAELFQERRLLSVTANTRQDGNEFLELAARIPVRVSTTPYSFSAADRALTDLAADRVSGAAVLHIAASPADAR
ncbi:zinc-dependent alcohol dehydrogenase family protein [Arthrobacter sp. ZGTC212]|uniref:zinc-dependent alcohol dehydrogenase family protein n=1 Tax=Arthrobacter sp. ZGTC212 TaxID=2058899 RepID=UPI000CE4A26A|nr:zinc-dependent alcohol dehydrogenase family protein [Arthrobacter sp. ZGTC212]